MWPLTQQRKLGPADPVCQSRSRPASNLSLSERPSLACQRLYHKKSANQALTGDRNLRDRFAHPRRLPKSTPNARSEIKVQSKLGRPAVERGPADLSEVRDPRIGVGLRELRVIRQVEEIRRERKAHLLPSRDLEILLQGEVKIVDAGISDIGEVARRIPKGLVDIEWTRQIYQATRWTRPGEVECARVKPVARGLLEARRERIADHHGTIRQHSRAVAESIGIVRNPD